MPFFYYSIPIFLANQCGLPYSIFACMKFSFLKEKEKSPKDKNRH